MPEHETGTREDWQAARDELAKLEAEHAKLDQKVTEQRRRLPWVRGEKEHEFDTEDGKKTLAELFDGRSQLLAYNIMFGPDYELGPCPGCTNLGEGLDGALVHLAHRDVTLICFSRAPIDRLVAYKQRMGWGFPYVSTHGSDFPFDFWPGVRRPLPLRLRARLAAGAATADPADQGDDRQPTRVARGLVAPGRGQAR